MLVQGAVCVNYVCEYMIQYVTTGYTRYVSTGCSVDCSMMVNTV